MSDNFQDELVALLPRLRRFAMTLTGNLHEADDLVQQACEKALLKKSQWQPGTRLDSWVYRIIQNQHIDTLRSRGRRGEEAPEFVLAELADPVNADSAEQRDLLSRAAALIDDLPEEQRVVMLLVAVEEHSYREAAELLDVPVGTVMSRLARARAKIVSRLNAVPGKGEDATAAPKRRGDQHA